MPLSLIEQLFGPPQPDVKKFIKDYLLPDSSGACLSADKLHRAYCQRHPKFVDLSNEKFIMVLIKGLMSLGWRFSFHYSGHFADFEGIRLKDFIVYKDDLDKMEALYQDYLASLDADDSDPCVSIPM